MGLERVHLILFCISCFAGIGQDVAFNEIQTPSFEQAYAEASEGDYRAAQNTILQVTVEHPEDIQAQALLGSTYSWSGKYNDAREAFNHLTSEEKNNRKIWISSIKNELYAENWATALGLSNKALAYIKNDSEIERLRKIAMQKIEDTEYPESGWFDETSELKENLQKPDDTQLDTLMPKTPFHEDVSVNRLFVQNAYTVFDQIYDPVIASSISYRRQTLAGSLIPRVNYNNRRNINGLQYELDFYPKFSKRFYAYLNYGFSESTIYPNHKFGGDLYINLPNAIEISAGGRRILYDTQNVTVVTNSLGHYRGNYYVSLRSYITPLPDRLTRVSGNLLVRKYGKDAENFMGINFGMGFSPELRQLIAGDELLAETLLYVASQRLSFEYQFTGKKNPNSYRANMGITRQELVFDSGAYFWSLSAGLTYQVIF